MLPIMESSAAGTTTQAPAGREIRVPETAEAGSRRWYIDGKPVWEMSADQLRQAAKKLEDQRPQYMEALGKVFGPRNAARFARLVEDESPDAVKAARQMHEALPTDERATIDRILLQGGTVAASELRELEKKLLEVQRADSPTNLLDEVLKYAFTERGDHPRPHTMGLQQLGALMQLRAGYELVAAKNEIDKEWKEWDASRISDEIVSSAIRRFPSEDLYVMFGRYLRSQHSAVSEAEGHLRSSVVKLWKEYRPQELQASTAAPKRDRGHDGGHSA